MFYILIIFLQPLSEAVFSMVWSSFNLYIPPSLPHKLLFNILEPTELKGSKSDIYTVCVYSSIQQLIYKRLTYLKFRSTLPDLKILTMLQSVSLMKFKLLNNVYVKTSFLTVAELKSGSLICNSVLGSVFNHDPGRYQTL